MRSLFVSLALILLVPLARAQAIAPDVLMKTVTDEVLAAVRADKDIQAGDATRIAVLVEAKIVPQLRSRKKLATAASRA